MAILERHSFPSGRAVADGPTAKTRTRGGYCPSVREPARPPCYVLRALDPPLVRLPPAAPQAAAEAAAEAISEPPNSRLVIAAVEIKSRCASPSSWTDMDARTEGRRRHRQEGEGRARVQPVAELPLGHGSPAAAPAAAAAAAV